ncbi:MAG: c-type cytochrome, partial [Acidobacteriota bacterium]|nr:c-type cytochrome [Acidobacteriota bacterium]
MSARIGDSLFPVTDVLVSTSMTFSGLVSWLACLAVAIPVASAQTISIGRRQFESRCVACHGGDANGGEHGPSIVSRIWGYDDAGLAKFIRSGNPGAGMPAFTLPDAPMHELVRFLRTLERPESEPKVRGKVQTVSGGSLEGLILNQNIGEMQMLTDDKRLHVLRKSGDRYRPVVSAADWTGYNGDPRGNRFSKLTGINSSNVGRLAASWIFPIPDASNLQVTPVVVQGVMYVTSANECWALDAGSGAPIWHYQRRRTKGIGGTAAGGVNRGVTVAGDRVFMVTDNAHLIALQRTSGELLWDIVMADWHQNYYATAAPLIAGDLVLSGIAGGDEGVRGFVS